MLRDFTVHTRFEIGLIDAQGAFEARERFVDSERGLVECAHHIGYE